MKIYIAGKISGEDRAACTMKFGTAQKAIEDLGQEAINPLEVVGDWNTTWENAMRKCIAAMMAADAVLFLPDTNDSKGAKIERSLALKLGIKRIYSFQELKLIISQS